jgi:hypothetical protein
LLDTNYYLCIPHLVIDSLQRKIIHGHPYYYIVQSRRVNGRPRPVVVEYLGTPDALLQRLRQTTIGALAALYHLAQQLGLVELINQFAPRRQQGPSLGQYMLVAAMNRAVTPTSKLQMPAWLRSTSLPAWLGVVSRQFASPRFWDNMELLGKAKNAVISEARAQRVMQTFRLDLGSLVFHCPNFDTFIDTGPTGQLAQRGHAKSKRADLRIVGLALLVSVDSHVPLLWCPASTISSPRATNTIASPFPRSYRNSLPATAPWRTTANPSPPAASLRRLVGSYRPGTIVQKATGSSGPLRGFDLRRAGKESKI